MMYRQFFLLAGTFLLISCSSIERDNPNDPNSDKYRGYQIIEPPVGEFSSGSGSAYSSSSKTVSCPAYNSETHFCDEREGKAYKITKIGTQTWIAENLNYNASGSKCYNNVSANCDIYGRLYNWSAAKTACPTGWHLPSNTDWNTLIKFVNPSCGDNSDCDGAGTELKAASNWTSDYEVPAGTDSHGFSALPGGNWNYTLGSFNGIGTYGTWWSATVSYKEGDKEGDYSWIYAIAMNYLYESVIWNPSCFEKHLNSVRCVKN